MNQGMKSAGRATCIGGIGGIAAAALFSLGIAGSAMAAPELGYGHADPAIPMADLMTVDNLYGFSVPENLEVRALLRGALGSDMDTLAGAMQVSGPVTRTGGRYVVASGCRAHACNEVQSIVVVDTRERRVFAGVAGDGAVRTWPGSPDRWPKAVVELVRADEASEGRLSILGAAEASRPSGDRAVVDLDDVDGSVIFDHNGSEMRIDGKLGVIVYDAPKASIRKAVKPGQVLFRGSIPDGGRVSGTAYTFKAGCAPAPYAVSGGWQDLGRPTLVLEGAAPKRAKEGCAVVGTTRTGGNARLEFTFLVSP